MIDDGRRARVRGWATIWMAAAVLATTLVAPDARAAGRITGSVTDPDGEPLRDVVLRFVPLQGPADAALQVETNRKGRFGFGLEAAGPYRIEVPDGLYVASVEVVVKTSNGVTVGRTEVEGDPMSGLPAIPLADSQETRLLFVVAPLEAEVAAELALAAVSPALQEVVDLYEADDLDAALAAADAAIADAPQVPEARYLRALVLRDLSRPADAERDLLVAIEAIPDHPGIHGLLGEVRLARADGLRAAGNTADADRLDRLAAADLARELERKPDAVEALVNRAAALERVGDIDALIPALEAVIDRLPDQPEAYLRLAAAQSSRGDHEAAMATLRRMPGDDARAAVTIYNIAARLYNDGRHAAAELAARRAVEIDPNLAPAYRLIGESLIARGDRDAAIAPLQRFVALAPEDDPDRATYSALLEALTNP